MAWFALLGVMIRYVCHALMVVQFCLAVCMSCLWFRPDHGSLTPCTTGRFAVRKQKRVMINHATTFPPNPKSRNVFPCLVPSRRVISYAPTHHMWHVRGVTLSNSLLNHLIPRVPLFWGVHSPRVLSWTTQGKEPERRQWRTYRHQREGKMWGGA